MSIRPPSKVRLLALALAVVLTACGGGGPPLPALATTPAERASWPTAPRDAVSATVERSVDGDTFIAEVAGRRERIRVIGVNTPETVAPDRPVEPYGPEASKFAKHWLGSGSTVRLVGDVESRDHFGRLLAYVWLRDGTFWDALLLAEGYGRPLAIPPDVTYAPLFERLAAEARAAHRGLWKAA